MLVQEFLERTADRLPEKTALVCDGRRWTYAQIEADSNRLAHALRKNGIQRSDRVVIFLPNTYETIISIFAVLKAGAVFVVVNPTTKYPKVVYLLNNCQARAMVTSGQHARYEELISQASHLELVVLTSPPVEPTPSVSQLLLSDLLSGGSSSRLDPVNIDLDLACLIYTSGSTGEAKGVMSDHNNVDFATSSIIQYLQNDEKDIVIDLLPLSFDYGLYQVLMTFKFGGTLILEKGFLFPSAVLKTIKDEKVTGFPGVPTIFAILLQMDLTPFDLSSLRYITNTAAALPVSHILRLRNAFPDACLYSMYGLTETKRTLYLPPKELEHRPGSVGIAIPGTEVWLEDEEGRRLPNGGFGELVVRGRHVMRGYWDSPDLTAQRFRPGSIPGERVCYSGDLFRSDEDGFMYFVSRKDDMIKCKGEKVSPVEIERILYELDGVVEAAVIGLPDPILGQAIKAFVVANDQDLNAAAVLRHCRSRMEDFMIPRYVEFCAQLPKTESGKIKKTDLH
jgi:long-chain acyl-CoA synthetase